ncbi:MAG TPA: ABC transporter permease [Pyrinomonadaceae bacterium]|nr:ABC transporter permease [Pyrinomonadaceae bacterium]
MNEQSRGLSDAIRANALRLKQDLHWAQRSLRRSAAFTIMAVFVAAMGIGANTAAFTLLDYVLLRPLPFTNPEQLVMVYQTQPANGITRMITSAANFDDWRKMSKSFASMGAFSEASVNMSGEAEPQRLRSMQITEDVLPALGVKPAFGRDFTPEDYLIGTPDVMLLSHGLAKSMYGDPAKALGRTVHLDNRPFIIVGVMPADFAFPSRDTQLWQPLVFPPFVFQDPAQRSSFSLNVVGRLRPGVSVEQASAEMGLIGEQLQRAHQKANEGIGVTVVALRDVVTPQSRMLVIGVFGAAFCLILIACANLANLLFARSVARRREIAVRVAMGAGRGRILRQLFTENLLLALAGGVFGLLLGALATPLLVPLVPDALPINEVPQVNMRVFAFVATLSVITCLIFGVVPALRASNHVDLNALRGRTSMAGRSDRLRRVLVLAEVVCTVVLLIGAGLLVKALWRVQSVDPGFNPENVLTMRTDLPIPKYFDAALRNDFYNRVLTQARALPGVTSAAYTSFLPLVFQGGILPVTVPGAAQEGPPVRGNIRFVTPDYFATLGIPIRSGRDVSDTDTLQTPLAVVISESLAKRLWPGQDPLGKQLNVAFADRTVVGVAGEVMMRSLERPNEGQIYMPASQFPARGLIFFFPKDLVVRATGDATSHAPALRRIIHGVDPEQAVADVRLLEDVVSSKTASRRTQLHVVGGFTLIAFLLSAVGIYGLLSFAVLTRTQEVGVRLALGARPGNILGMFLRQGLVLGVLGLVVGVPLAYAAARAMSSVLFSVEPTDVVTYASACLLVLVMALVGSFIPAMRASRVDPSISIRGE